MGLMTKLRDKTHVILIILVVAFLITIIFEWGMNYIGLKSGQVTEFGSVNGREIDYKEFESQVQFATEQQKQQTGEDPDESTIQMIRDQVWDQMVSQILAQQEIERLGIKVTNEEILNWVYNSPQTLPDPIKRNFIDSTGQFNMEIYQQALSTKSPEVTKFWAQVEQYLKQLLLSQKLQSVITGTVRVSEGDVLQKFKDDNIIASFNYALISTAVINDNQVQITDEDLRTYFNNHKEDFKREESVKLKYILFSDAPTIEDSTITEKQLKALTKEFKRYTVNDTDLKNFVNTNSLNKYNDTVYYKPNELAPEVANFLFSAKIDSISDVIKASDGYHLVKLFGTKEGDAEFTNASHILINFGTDTNAAKVKAEQVFKRAKSGEDFNKLASDFSDDATNKFKGGSLGWFTKGAMVKEFEDASLNGRVGDIIGPIKTQFGYHIIKINDRQKKLFKAADIKMLVKTSSKTKDVIRKRAEDLTFVARKENFEEEAKKLNLLVLDIPAITKTSFIPGAGQNQNVIKFAFSESKKSVSDPIKIQGGYAVYYITDKLDAGYMNFDEIKDNVIKPKVLQEKKLDIIKPRMQDLKTKISNNDLNSIKTTDQSVYVTSVDSFSVSKPDPIIGSDFELTNALFKLSNGQISDPIRTNKGYYIVQIKNITPFDQEKFKTQSDIIRQQLTMQKKQTIVQDWLADLKDRAVIVDNRDKFFHN